MRDYLKEELTRVRRRPDHVGVAGALTRRSNARNYPVTFWRTKSGLEVDLVLADAVIAIEVKGSSRVDGRDLRALSAFTQ